MPAEQSMTAEQRAVTAGRLRQVMDSTQLLNPEDGAWLSREEAIQVAALLGHWVELPEEAIQVDEARTYRFMTDADFHAWVKLEARIAAEIELAKALGTVVADTDVATFLREQNKILDSPVKRERFDTDETYRRAVFTLAIAAVADSPEGQRATAEQHSYLMSLLELPAGIVLPLGFEPP